MSEKARPIIMTGWSVQRILAGAKTQTRRLVKPQPNNIWSNYRKCPYGKPGDLLWVRETWGYKAMIGGPFYKADQPPNSPYHHGGIKWCSPIYMSRRDSRITLRIKDIRVERVQDISEKDAKAEGIERGDSSTYNLMGVHRALFSELWDSIYAKTYPWESNPWVWAIEFDIC